jgi:hypothetical protein
MRGLKIIAILGAVCLTMPIWFFLLYRILIAVNATELMWFLYWIYLPASLIVNIISQIIVGSKND